MLRLYFSKVHNFVISKDANIQFPLH